MSRMRLFLQLSESAGLRRKQRPTQMAARWPCGGFPIKKSCIWETKHLSTDVDSSTNTTVGWTKNTQKADALKI